MNIESEMIWKKGVTA